MNSDKQQYFNVSLPVPLRRSFSYSTSTDANIVVGLRVLVPFGARQLVGIVVEANIEADPKIKIKAIISILDSIPIADTLLAKLIKWSSDYYHHPLGEVWQAALPKRVRLAKPLDDPDLQKAYFITDDYLAGISSDAIEEQLKQELSKR